MINVVSSRQLCPSSAGCTLEPSFDVFDVFVQGGRYLASTRKPKEKQLDGTKPTVHQSAHSHHDEHAHRWREVSDCCASNSTLHKHTAGQTSVEPFSGPRVGFSGAAPVVQASRFANKLGVPAICLSVSSTAAAKGGG